MLRQLEPEVFARLDPQTFLERHIEAQTRPCGRSFNQHRNTSIQPNNNAVFKHLLGSAVLRSSGTTILCAVVGGLTDFRGQGGIYPNLTIHRGGRSAAPSQEEMIRSYELQRLIYAAKFDPKSFELIDNKELVLQASVTVLSRNGPLLAPAYKALYAALEDVRIPPFIFDDETQTVVPDLSVCREDWTPLDLPDTIATDARAFGLFENTLLCDPEGYTEEICLQAQATITGTKNHLSSVFLAAPHGDLESKLEEMLRDCP